ncbi:hypothetical protein [Silvimonas sp.]|uniref:hypothetical protein n=1 Tax=Silvimonas sp. TaxID=2650811 RepID=UPI00284AB960|nr:hypothetical protein [Silvimonas sp.]MDR3427830.1 hypothetical protein [Silvimonas sp.]
MSEPTKLTEAEVRALRDSVYGQPSTDKCWDACGEKWMQPENVEWLKSQKPHTNL